MNTKIGHILERLCIMWNQHSHHKFTYPILLSASYSGLLSSDYVEIEFNEGQAKLNKVM